MSFFRIPCSTRNGITWVRQTLLKLGVSYEADPRLKSFNSSAIRKAYAQFANEPDGEDSQAQEAIRVDAARHMGHANQTADRHYRADVSVTCVFQKILLYLIIFF